MDSSQPLLVGSIEFTHADGRENSIDIPANEVLTFGRDSGSSVAIPGLHASGKHFLIYSIIPDPDKLHAVPPLVYCQDLSSVGTYANRRLIKPKSAVLLQNGWSIIVRRELECWFFQTQTPCKISSTSTMDREMKCFQQKYIILDQLLGIGGWGVVRVAYGKHSTDQVACKIVKAKDTSVLLAPRFSRSAAPRSDTRKRRSIGEDDNLRVDRKYSQSYMKEANLLSKLDHPSIVRLVEAFHGVGQLYMILELYPGGDLFSYLYRVGTLPEKHVIGLLYQILSGVEHLHALNIVHRDLKLENILLSRLDAQSRVVITDFGNATHHVTGGRHRMNSFVGTTGYQAPELAEGSSHGAALAYDESVDIWATGIMTAMLISGQEIRDLATRPSDSRTPYPPDLEKLGEWSSLTSPLRKLIRRMLAYDVDKRLTAAQAKLGLEKSQPGVLRAYERAVEDWEPRRKHGSSLIHDLRSQLEDEEDANTPPPGQGGQSRFWNEERASPIEGATSRFADTGSVVEQNLATEQDELLRRDLPKALA